ncbi:MAG TPA: F0F1 ATP synthase subunit epsilon [Thermomicrobiales bacterium]|nr:F0F1 ATP synthase subunit epsilon [Thermomicrobiales bacterium]
MATLTMELVTGERVVYQADGVDEIIAPGSEGTLGILPNHAALISLLDAGELRVKKGGSEESLVVFGGFIEVLDNRVIVLADSAERAEEIDLERASSARERAETSLHERGERQSVEEAEAALRRAAVRLKVGERVRRRHSGRPQA